MQKVRFIAANNGALELYRDVEDLIIASSDSLELAVAIQGLGLDFSEAYASSSMDFASEYGFLNDSAAYDLLTQALERV